MKTVEDVYAFVAQHPIVLNHTEAAYLCRLFSDLAAGTFEQRGAPPPTPSVLSFL